MKYFFALLVFLSVFAFGAPNALPSSATPGEALSFADSCYKHRADGANGDKANRARIDKAISAYRMAMKDQGLAERAALGLYKAEYFRIRFAAKDKAEREKFVIALKLLGDSLHAVYPKNKQLTSLYATVYSMWGNNAGALASVKNGVAARARDLADSAGDYQFLGRAHAILPYVPFVLSWPDKKLAEKYLLRAAKEDPKEPYNYHFLSEYYLDQGRYDECQKMIDKGLALPVRNESRLEDKRARWHMKETQKKLNKKLGK